MIATEKFTNLTPGLYRGSGHKIQIKVPLILNSLRLSPISQDHRFPTYTMQVPSSRLHRITQCPAIWRITTGHRISRGYRFQGLRIQFTNSPVRPQLQCQHPNRDGRMSSWYSSSSSRLPSSNSHSNNHMATDSSRRLYQTIL